MAIIGSASLNVTPSFDGFQGKLEGGTDKAMTAAGSKGGAKFGDAAGQSASSRFKGHIKNAAKIAAVGLAGAGIAAFKFAGDALEEAREAQKVGALTESTIKATGSAAKVTAKHVSDLAGAISDKSGVDDEAIQSGANMLLTFKNIRNEAGKNNKIFDRTTKATADMAAAMAGGKGGDLDLKSSSILLGKALNDPVKGLAALTRVGIQFTDQQKAINKALVEGGTLNAMAAFGTKVTQTEFNKVMKDNNATYEETVRLIMGPLSSAQQKLFKHYEEGGHALEAQKNILKEVNSQFGGAAAAQATEAEKLQVAWGNLKEEVGTKLIPVMDDLARFLRKKGIPAAEKFVNWFKDDGVDGLKKFGGYVKTTAGYAKDLAKFLNDLPKPAKIAGLTALFGGIAAMKLRGGALGGGGVLGTVGKAVGLAKPVPVFVTNPGLGGLGGPAAGPTSKLGKVASVASKAALPVAIVSASAVALKGLWDWNHKGDKNPVDTGLGGGKIGDWSRNFFGKDDAKEYEKNLGVVNNAWAKVGKTTDGSREKVVLYRGEVEKVPTLWRTMFEAPGLARDKALVEQYGSLLDGLPRDVKIRFTTSVTNNNDTGEGGGANPQPPGRSGPGDGGGVHVRIGTVEAHDYNDFMTQLERRLRAGSLDGVG